MKACVENEVSAEVARTVMLCEVAASQSSSSVGDGDDTGVGIDGESATGVVIQAVGNRIGRRVRIGWPGR